MIQFVQSVITSLHIQLCENYIRYIQFGAVVTKKTQFPKHSIHVFFGVIYVVVTRHMNQSHFAMLTIDI